MTTQSRSMNFIIKNCDTGKVYGHAKTLSEARALCGQLLLKASKDRTMVLSDIAAGLIDVFEAKNTNYIHPGF